MRLSFLYSNAFKVKGVLDKEIYLCLKYIVIFVTVCSNLLELPRFVLTVKLIKLFVLSFRATILKQSSLTIFLPSRKQR